MVCPCVSFALAGFLAATGSPQSTPITHGPVLGAAAEDSIQVWARVFSDQSVRAVCALDPAFTTGLRASSSVRPSAEQDFTITLQLSNLEVESVYFYFLESGPGSPNPWRSQTFSFRTSPPATERRMFRFAVLADASQDPSASGAAYAAAAADAPDFVLQIGDLDHRNPAAKGAKLENWRAMYRDQLGDLAAGRTLTTLLTPFVPLYHIWDDHDYGDNNADRTAPWKATAKRAFTEYFPLPQLPNPSAGLWYSVRYAQAEFFVLDLRYQRDPDDDPDGPWKSMLDGARIRNDQKDWLLQSLDASNARWKFLVSSSCWNPRGKQIDSWALYQNEQQEIVEFVRNRRIRGIVVLSADIHSGGAIDDGRNSYAPEISVPSTNTPRPKSGCTGGDGCGTWSVGVKSHESDPSGYALITVEPDPLDGADSVLLQAKDATGAVRLEYRVR